VQHAKFLETETILSALEFTSAKGGFGKNAKLKTTAETLIRSMKSKKSFSGRQQQLRALLKKGATIGDMIKAINCSRRTVFRYLNDFEDAGLAIVLTDGKYRLK
jgi:hypothetical protein